MAGPVKVQLKDANGNSINPQTTAAAVSTASSSTVEAELGALKSSVSGQTVCKVKADIAARDALTGMKEGDQCWVKDASADPTVDSGAAKYIYEGADAGWVKTGEAESMDIHHDWSDIENGPSATPEQINAAASQTHAHVNRALLDGISADDVAGTVTIGGKTYYAGRQVAIIEAGGEIPADMAANGIVFEKIAAA